MACHRVSRPLSVCLEAVLALMILYCQPLSSLKFGDPDNGKDIRQLVEGKGFGFEEYPLKVGIYLIKLHRILKPARCKGSDPRKVVVFGEPLGGASDLWVLDMVNNSWAFYFARNCFDVWLTNCRGTNYGNTYANGSQATPFDNVFYDYTFVDIGAEDLTAQLDLILEKTGQEKVFWFGMSQGAFSAYAMLSKRPEYNAKVRALASLGSARSLCHSVLRRIAYAVGALGSEFRNGLSGLPGGQKALTSLCATAFGLCSILSFLVGGRLDNGIYTNKTRLIVYAEHFPHGTSVKNLLYYLQLAATCDGGQHEYDEDRFEDQALIKLNPEKYSKNLKKYGTLEPPKIPNSKITVPVKLYTSIGDFVVPVKDVQLLARELPNFAGLWKINDRKWTHLTFAVPAMYGPIFKDVRDFYESFLEPPAD